MPTPAEIAGTFFDAEFAAPASSATADVTTETAPAPTEGTPPVSTAPADPPAPDPTDPPADPPTPPAPTTATPPAPPEPGTQGNPGCVDASVDTGDLQAIKARFAADHPELGPVMDAFLKEAQRGLNRKFETLAVLRKEAAEQLATGQLTQGIPEADLRGLIQLHQLSVSDPARAADLLFTASEQLRSAPPVAPYPPSASPGGVNPAAAPWQNTPEWAALQQFQHTQQLQQIQTQIDQAYAALQPEFGGQAIPPNQREHVEAEAQRLGLGIEALPMIWRSTYGVEYARQAALKKGAALQAGKQSLSVTPGAPPAPAGPNAKPKSVADAIASVCDDYRVR